MGASTTTSCRPEGLDPKAKGEVHVASFTQRNGFRGLVNDRGPHFAPLSLGEGDGPGEFQNIRSVDRFRGDSLLVFDSRQFRASVFDTDGQFARSFPLRQITSSAYPALAGVLSDGALVVREDRPDPGTGPALRR